MKALSILRGNHGLSLIEVMVSIGIISITALGFLTMYKTTQGTSSKTVGKFSCQTYANDVINRIRGMGVSNQIAPILAADWTGNAKLRVTNGPTEAGIDPADRFADVAANDLTADAPGNRIILQNSHLIVGSINAMLAIYNQNPAGYCGGVNFSSYSPVAVAGNLKLLPTLADAVGDAAKLVGLQAELQITPYSRTTGGPVDAAGIAIGCPAGLHITPRGAVDAGVGLNNQFFSQRMATIFPYDALNPNREIFNGNVLVNGGLNVKVRISYDDPNEGAGAQQQSCMAETQLFYNDDGAIDPIPQIIADLAAPPRVYGLVQTAAYSATACGAGLMSHNNVQVRAGYDSSAASVEPGSVLLCRDKSWRLRANDYAQNIKEMACLNNGAVTSIFADTTELPLLPISGGPSNLVGSYYIGTDGNPWPLFDETKYSFDPAIHSTGAFATVTQYHDIGTNVTRGKTLITDYPTAFAAKTWVPCEEMVICGQNPTGAVRAVAGDDFYWELSYDNIQAGCTVNFDVALVDTAGNMTISQLQRTGGTGDVQPDATILAAAGSDAAFTTFEQTIKHPTCGYYCGQHPTTNEGYFSCGGSCPP